MAAPSLTYTLTNGTTADASAVMQNFNDLLLGYTDGTRDLVFNNLTANGSVILGATSVDVVTVPGTIGSDLLPTDVTYDLGSTTKNFVELHLNNGATDGGAVYFDGTTTSFIKSSADGLTLSGGGFTSQVGSFKNFCQAWVNFDGTGTPSIVDSFNVSSITDNGTGDYTINLTTAFANANYFFGGNSASEILDITNTTKTASTFRFVSRTNAGTADDSSLICVFAIGAR